MSTAKTKLLKRPQRRRALLDAAARAFARGGYAATSLDDVAAEAGVSRVLIYRHFQSKAELYQAVLAEVSDQLRAATGHPDHHIPGSLNGLVAAASANPDGFRLFFRQSGQEPEFRRHADELRQAMKDTAEPYLRTVIHDTARLRGPVTSSPPSPSKPSSPGSTPASPTPPQQPTRSVGSSARQSPRSATRPPPEPLDAAGRRRFRRSLVTARVGYGHLRSADACFESGVGWGARGAQWSRRMSSRGDAMPVDTAPWAEAHSALVGPADGLEVWSCGSCWLNGSGRVLRPRRPLDRRPARRGARSRGGRRRNSLEGRCNLGRGSRAAQPGVTDRGRVGAGSRG